MINCSPGFMPQILERGRISNTVPDCGLLALQIGERIYGRLGLQKVRHRKILLGSQIRHPNELKFALPDRRATADWRWGPREAASCRPSSRYSSPQGDLDRWNTGPAGVLV